MRILVTEDDENLLLAVTVSLRGAGLAVDPTRDLAEADEALAVNSYDCVVFDRMVPGGDTLRYVADRRRTGFEVPVLFLTALGGLGERVEGLTVGDDYLVKPFAVDELVARVLSLCRRDPITAPAVLRHDDVELDRGRREVRRAGTLLTLTHKQFLVLELLLANAGTPVSRTALIHHAWDEHLEPTSNVLDVLVGQLRRKLHDPPVVHTVRGFGYRVG